MHTFNFKLSRPLVLGLTAATLSMAGPVFAQFAKPEDAIKYRKSAMFVMQQNFARVGVMAAGKAPFDAKVAAESAAVVEYMSKLPWTGFAEGTDKGDTKAKPEIWTESAKFKEYADKMQSEVTKLSAASKTGNLESIKAAMGPAGDSCKACHDAYRSK